MSIDSQIKEMMMLAEREGLNVVTMKQESFSAKNSGRRPVFNQLLEDIEGDAYNAILTWAPDRLSRNAGDLGSLVDLMDGGKLLRIRSFSQSFSNTPNEKFMLMILCSQAKLENDNRGENVKRGIRAKCEMGWRPCQSPLGYIHVNIGGKRDIILDEERAPYIKEIFERAAEGESGYTIKQWLDTTTFRTRNGVFTTKSMLYNMMKNTYYYGEFEYPLKSDKWYKGNHPSIITKELFERVQKALTVPPRGKWGAKYFAFKGIAKCKDCGASIIGEEKFKQKKSGGRNRHVYYHCSRQIEYHCTQPFIREEDLINQVVDIIRGLDYKNLKVGKKLQTQLIQYDQMTKEHTNDERSNEEIFYAYTNYLMRYGDNKDKADFLMVLNLPFMLDNRHIYYSPSEFNQLRRDPDREYLTRKQRTMNVKSEDARERYLQMQRDSKNIDKS